MAKKKVILDLCGGTGAWSEPWKKAGYDVKLITLPDYSVLHHSMIDREVIKFLPLSDDLRPIEIRVKDIYGVLAAPPCTKFSKADTRLKRHEKDFIEGIRLVECCLQIVWSLQSKGAPLTFWALENPQGYLSRFIGRSTFRFQHWEFGEKNPATATKRTELWGYFNNPIRIIRHRPKGAYIGMRKKNAHWSRIGPADRAKTCGGFAEAFLKANR